MKNITKKLQTNCCTVICSMILCLLAGYMTGCSTSDAVSLEEAIFALEKEASEAEEFSLEKASEGAADVLKAEESLAYVYVCGEVKEPGVYALPLDSRIVAAVEAAGGFLQSAAMEAVNLAEPVRDGMQITIPSLLEYASLVSESTKEAAGQVNLNTASLTELCTLNGIGEAKAEAILAYRREIGGFTSITQLKDVSGIGDRLFEQIKEDIYIE